MTAPLWFLLVGLIFYRERLTWNQIVGISAFLSGLILLGLLK